MKKPARRLSKLSFPTSPTAIRADDLKQVTGGGITPCQLIPCIRTIIPCLRIIIPCVRPR